MPFSRFHFILFLVFASNEIELHYIIICGSFVVWPYRELSAKGHRLHSHVVQIDVVCAHAMVTCALCTPAI